MPTRWLARIAPTALACLALSFALGSARPGDARAGKAPLVVLVGGVGHEASGRHEYARGLERIAGWLRADGLRVRAFPRGWPGDPAAFDNAAALVWYFDGGDAHPLADAAHRAQFESLMRRGVGLVALHQASTVRADEDYGLQRVLGAVRPGLFDRSTEWTRLAAPAGTVHPVLRGVAPFAYRDEFYPTLNFAGGAAPPVVLLEASLHPQFRGGAAVLADAAETRPVAWTFERSGGGRAVGFSGAHFLDALG